MRKLGVLFIGCLSLMIPIVSAGANATQSLSIESFEFIYEPTGLPVVHLLLNNEGDGSLEPEIAITLKKAYSGRQDAYVYRKKALAKPDKAPVVLAGHMRPVSIHVDRLLSAGDYEAEVKVKNQRITFEKTYEFSVAEKDVRSAKLALKANHLQQFNDNDTWIWRYWTTGTGLVLILLVSAWMVRRNRGKKQ